MRIKIIAILSSFILMTLTIYAQEYLTQIKSKTDFDSMAGLPLSGKYGQVSALKIVYDLRSRDLYFINGSQYKYHFQFCSDYLNDPSDLLTFNDLNYASQGRKYLLANINYFKSQNKYVLEIAPVDMMTVTDILKLYQVVKDHISLKDKLFFFINSSRLVTLESSLNEHISVISSSDIYNNQTYQAIGCFKGTGTMRYVKDIDALDSPLNRKDILVLTKVPKYFPTVAGIIITEFQTPLSHLSLLGLNRKIPICAYKNAFIDSSLLKYNRCKVSLDVNADTFYVHTIDRFDTEVCKQKKIKLRKDLSIISLVDVSKLNKNSVSFAGNKAANFGILYQLSKKADFKVPESAFAIPFYFYENHLVKSHADSLIRKILLSNSRKDSIKEKLKQIRNVIIHTPIDSCLLYQVKKKIMSLGNYTRVRFRSSTNAEDTKGFSGAGLYDSKTGDLTDSLKTIEKAIKKVWASLWSYEAFSEREYFNISNEEVSMGILVHRSFPDEKVNGVAITKNIYRPGNYGFIVNAQLGDEKVVQPENGVMCDQFICYPDDVDNMYKNKNVVDIIAYSSLNNNKLVMSNLEIQRLANILEYIKLYFADHIYRTFNYLDLGLDIEFKLVGENHDLYIKQVRIYND